MDAHQPGTITQLLDAVGRGDEAARSRLWTVLHDELHRMAQQKLAKEPFVRSAATLLSTRPSFA